VRTAPTREGYIKRFWSYVDIQGPDDCWKYIGTIASRGYGQFYANGKSGYAHRFAYEIENGEGSTKGMFVGHTCHNHSCCNPHHLLLVADRSCKLSRDDVIKIRELLEAGVMQRNLARQYGVAESTIYGIRKKFYWRDV
jgi:hypothetical protein